MFEHFYDRLYFLEIWMNFCYVVSYIYAPFKSTSLN